MPRKKKGQHLGAGGGVVAIREDGDLTVLWAAYEAGAIVRDKLQRALLKEILEPEGSGIRYELLERRGKLSTHYVLRVVTVDAETRERVEGRLRALARDLARVRARR